LEAWWRTAELALERFAHEADLGGWERDGERLHPTVHGVRLPAASKTSAALVIALHGDSVPGAVYRCALVQRLDGEVVGGNTIEIRVSPREVEGQPVVN
jgi:hypothetical protein